MSHCFLLLFFSCYACTVTPSDSVADIANIVPFATISNIAAIANNVIITLWLIIYSMPIAIHIDISTATATATASDIDIYIAIDIAIAIAIVTIIDFYIGNAIVNALSISFP